MKNADNTVLGILAHVDAGKTTLSEAMLFLSGKLKTLGRVDHRDSFLDTHSLERQRGITIFSKQAVMPLGDGFLSLLDTPGHVDFSAEAERTLRVLDCAVLVISGTDGVQAHTETLWKLLERYGVPTFLFVTKMDLPGPGREALMKELTARLSERCVDFGAPEAELLEGVALCDEETMERFFETGAIPDETVRDLVAGRKLFPCFFGSGLKTDGVAEFLDALERYAPRPVYEDGFSARVYKISRDAQGSRLTWLKVTGGSLKVRSLLRYQDAAGETLEEKISALRIYSGTKFETAEEVRAGWVCAALGLSATRPGQGLGAAADAESAVLERFDTRVELDAGRVLYRETIKSTVEGVGHFEPLRHYAEVHLLLEPLPQGSGLSFDSICPEDALDRNWQRLILTHLAEKQHRGVLTGSPITDMRITLAAGRAHLKHTEGGDFRQATYRAVRQGLMQAESVLLEPWYSFVLEVPAEQIGRAISDVRAMNGGFSSPEERGELLRLEGAAPAAKLNGYMEELPAYTHGRGRLSLTPCGYRPCAEQKRIVEELGYEAERDEDNPADSVFCAHGAGFNVRWDEVPQYMHLDSVLRPKREESAPAPALRFRNLNIDERELEAIMEREFGPIRRPEYRARQVNAAVTDVPRTGRRHETVIVDGYNLIFAWDELKNLAAERLDLARARLMDILSGYAGFTGDKVVLVFDGFRTPGNPGSRSDYHNISVVFTKDGETGDAYIERIADEIGKNYAVRIVTSDNLIRVAALRSGVLRCSSGEFKGELEWALSQIDEVLKRTNFNAHKTRLIDGTRRDP